MIASVSSSPRLSIASALIPKVRDGTLHLPAPVLDGRRLRDSVLARPAG
jgi:hypothetical protein